MKHTTFERHLSFIFLRDVTKASLQYLVAQRLLFFFFGGKLSKKPNKRADGSSYRLAFLAVAVTNAAESHQSAVTANVTNELIATSGGEGWYVDLPVKRPTSKHFEGIFPESGKLLVAYSITHSLCVNAQMLSREQR